MKPISEEKRNAIISLLDKSLSARKIEPQLKVGRRTVDKVRAEARPEVPKSRGGRPAKLTAADKRWLVRNVTSGKADDATELRQELKNVMKIDVSDDTVRRALKQAGLKAAVKQKKPRLLPRHIRERRDFALRYQYWTVADWKRVVFSDEAKINRLGSDGRKWVWKRPGSALIAQQVAGTVKFGGGSLMLWGCMTASGVGYACRIDGGMDAQLYVAILGDEFLNTLGDYGLDSSKIVFQQDNDPKHTSGMASKWLEHHGIEVLEWPPQSPDLNPMEHLWHYLKQQLAAYEVPPASIDELWRRVEVEWYKIPKQVCVDLIESMPRRVAAVLQAKGGNTKY